MAHRTAPPPSSRDATATPPPDDRSTESANAVLRVRGLTHRVTSGDASLTILAGVDLQVAAGERVAIVGASGSGKSTLLGLLAGLDSPSAGEIHLLGQPLHAMDEDARAALRRGRVGFVFQSFQLLPALTALENVRLPLELARAAGARLQRSDIDRRAHEALRAVGLGARANHLPAQLSGGEQQRVAIARAFVERPDVLFADEPTGNLDRVTGQRIVDLLFDDAAPSAPHARRPALILVTHDEGLAARCDRVVRLVDGRLVAQSRASTTAPDVPREPSGGGPTSDHEPPVTARRHVA